MLREVLRVMFPFNCLPVFMAREIGELGLHLSTYLDCSSSFGGIAEPRPFLTVTPAADPENERSALSCRGVPPGQQHLTSPRKEHVQPVEDE